MCNSVQKNQSGIFLKINVEKQKVEGTVRVKAKAEQSVVTLDSTQGSSKKAMEFSPCMWKVFTNLQKLCIMKRSMHGFQELSSHSNCPPALRNPLLVLLRRPLLRKNLWKEQCWWSRRKMILPDRLCRENMPATLAERGKKGNSPSSTLISISQRLLHWGVKGCTLGCIIQPLHEPLRKPDPMGHFA